MQEQPCFMAWTEAYVAMPNETEWDCLTLTSFYPEGTQDWALKQAERLEFDFGGETAPVEIIGYRLTSEDMQSQEKGLLFCAMNVTIAAKQEGLAKCEGIHLIESDGNDEYRRIGTLIFDIGPKEPEIPALYTYSGAALATSPESFSYSWGKEDTHAAITAIQYGMNQIITSPNQILDGVAGENGLPASGSIVLDAYNAPLVYIKAKITVQTLAGTQIEYAKGCYCGTDFDASDIEASRKHNLESQNA